MADLVPQGEQQDAHSRSPRNFPVMRKGYSAGASQVAEDYSSEGSRDNPIPDVSWDKEKGDWGKDKYTMSPNELRKHVQ